MAQVRQRPWTSIVGGCCPGKAAEVASAAQAWGLADLLGRIEGTLGLGEEGETATWGYRVQATG